LKFIVAGSRHLPYDKVFEALLDMRLDPNYWNGIYSATEIVSGCAKGADLGGEKYAEYFCIPLKKFPAEWEKYGNRAGPIRNNKMAVYADALVLIWDGKSKGSRHMKEAMLALKKPVYEIIMGET
jgi:hypothetical protein